MLRQQAARPEQVNEAPAAVELPDGLLESGDSAAANAEDVEEVVPRGLAFGGLVGFALPFPAERDGAAAYFIPRQWHWRRLPRSSRQTMEISPRKHAGGTLAPRANSGSHGKAATTQAIRPSPDGA